MIYEYLSGMIKAILFDMDDLMVNSAPLHMEASRVAFEKYGVDLSVLKRDEIAAFFGRRVSDILKFMLDNFDYSKDIDFEKLSFEREGIFLDMIRKELECMPGLFELIRRIEKTKCKRGVASSGTKKYVTTVLDKFGLNSFFDTVVTGDMVKHGKPAPDIFLEAAKRLKVEPASCVVLEDATLGVEAAKKAGMFCIGVKNQMSEYEQDLSNADIIVDSLGCIDDQTFKKVV